MMGHIIDVTKNVVKYPTDVGKEIASGFLDGILKGLKESFFKLLKTIGIMIMASSYWVCLLVCIFCVLLYICGEKRSAKYSVISLLIYVLIQAIGVSFS